MAMNKAREATRTKLTSIGLKLPTFYSHLKTHGSDQTTNLTHADIVYHHLKTLSEANDCRKDDEDGEAMGVTPPADFLKLYFEKSVM
ncbi:hypothetical protein L6452_02760 [Arctium lappa]|uniref:Uncharacterized protein n=1 Tax=Arctium lappa TaxID=4217 RepID=A0ACB9FJU2_ARCLA|nr:hypothetical protein L6452_02760 [Arctium lappa]